jgi:polyisoprenoid-binding protein YceI
MLRKISITIIISFMFNFAFSQSWIPVTAGVSFTTKMLGVKVVGNFKGFKGDITFNPEDLNSASILGTVDAATIDTDNNLRNTHLKEKPEFFDVVKFPVIKMKSTKITKNGDKYLGVFNLTIKSVTKSVNIPFTAEITDGKAVFKGSATINRKDWSVGGSTFGMSNDVTINLIINAKQK